MLTRLIDLAPKLLSICEQHSMRQRSPPEEGTHAAWHRKEQFHRALSKHQTHTRQKSSSTAHGTEERHPGYHIHFSSRAKPAGTHVLMVSRHRVLGKGRVE